jgi:hypothetical protein
MQCILYKIYFWKVFHMYYKLICILYALLCGQNFILVKSGCYSSWLYYFHGWSLYELVHIFGYDVYHRLPESNGHSSELSESTERSSNPSPQIPILHSNKEQQRLTG